MFTTDELYDILHSDDDIRINKLRLYKTQFNVKELTPLIKKVIKNVCANTIFNNIEFIMDIGYKNMTYIVKNVPSNCDYETLLYVLSMYNRFNNLRHVVTRVLLNHDLDMAYCKQCLSIFHFHKTDYLLYLKKNNTFMIQFLIDKDIFYRTNDIEFDVNFQIPFKVCEIIVKNNCQLPHSVCYNAIKYNNHRLLNFALENGYKVIIDERMVLSSKIKKVLKKYNM